MKNKILLIGLVMLMVLPIVFGAENQQTTLGTFKKDSTIQLSQYCVNCTYVNLSSVKNPNGLYVLQGEYEMNKNGSDYHYNFSNTNTLGEYIYCVHGDPDGKEKGACSNFYITTEGLNLSNYTVLLIVLVFAYLILALGIWKEEVVFVTLGAMGIIILGAYINLNGISDMRNWITNAFGVINWGIGAYVLVRAYGEEAVSLLGN